jgi:signal transduction histidine kinase
MGLTVAQVVHGYGDVCQVITELAIEQENAISTTEFGRLNLCLDDAIASAVTAFARTRERRINAAGTERLGILAHEIRNLLNVATLAFESIKTGNVAPNGSTGRVMDRTLLRFRDLVDRSLAEVRLEAGVEHFERMCAAEFIEEVEIGAVILAKSRNVALVVTSVDPAVAIDGDRQLLAAAVTNLLQNAFKFTRANGTVALRVSATDARVLFEVEDECGGLPPGKTEELFRPYEQRGGDRSGVGLGLAICRKAAMANGGELRVRDLPGKGCVFIIDLPRKPAREDSVRPAAT